MFVYSIRLKIYFLCDVPLNKIQTKITYFLDKGFVENEELLKRHEKKYIQKLCVRFSASQ